MSELSKEEKRLINSAKEYLEPLKTVDKDLELMVMEIKQLQSNITTISAIDYSKDRVSGGGAPCGLENSVARFIDIEKEQRRRIDELTQYKSDATDLLYKLNAVKGAKMLRAEYLLGMTTQQACSIYEEHFKERQAMRYRDEAFIEVAKKIAQNVSKCHEMSVNVSIHC